MTAQSIESYEVATLSATGEMLISYNALDLGYGDGDSLETRVDGGDLVVMAESPFRIRRVPTNALSYLSRAGQIELLEITEEGAGRLATLKLAA